MAQWLARNECAAACITCTQVPNFVALECGYLEGIRRFVEPRGLAVRKVDLQVCSSSPALAVCLCLPVCVCVRVPPYLPVRDLQQQLQRPCTPGTRQLLTHPMPACLSARTGRPTP